MQKYINEEKYIQASVEVDYLLPKSSLKFAKLKLENALDILACYFESKTNVSISEHNYLIVNKEGRRIFSTFGKDKDDRFLNYYNSLNFSELDKHIDSLNEYSFLWDSNVENETVSKNTNGLF